MKEQSYHEVFFLLELIKIVALDKPGRMLYEMGGVTKTIAIVAIEIAACKMPIQTVESGLLGSHDKLFAPHGDDNQFSTRPKNRCV